MRVRTHANPLRRFPDLAPPDWPSVFRDPSLPFAIEFGSAKGEFLLAHAVAMPGWNILGTEIRKPVAMDAAAALGASGLTNVLAVWGNVAGRLVDFTPTGRIDAVFVLFPDPWFKARHHKRRLIQSALVAELATLMPSGALLHVLTDQPPLVEWTSDILAASPAFSVVEPRELPARSAWEEHCLRTGRSYEALAWARR